MSLPMTLDVAQSLTQLADREILELQPLLPHAYAEAEAHVRQHYGLALAALLASQTQISENQTRLFRLLLGSLGLGDARAALFESVRGWDAEHLSETLRTLRAATMGRGLLLDMLLLMRVDAPLSGATSQLLANFAVVLDVSTAELAELAYYAQCLLAIDMAESDPLVQAFRAVWPSQIPQRLQAEQLQGELAAGFYWVEGYFEVNQPWSAHAATFLFAPGALIRTTLAGNQSAVKLSSCRFVGAQLAYQGAGHLQVEQCDFVGDYPTAAEQATTALHVQGLKLTVNDCRFRTVNARAVLADGAELQVQRCWFSQCGSAHLDGGALYHHSRGRQVSHSHFADCVGARGGAIWVYDLYGIANCEFLRCRSAALAEQGGGDIALFCRNNAATPYVTGCTFQATSAYIHGVSSYNTGCANSQFERANLYWSNGSGTLVSNCTFLDGRVICKGF